MKFYERVQLCIVDSNLNSDTSIYQEQMITRVEMIPRVRLLTAYTIVHNRQQYQGSRFKYNNLCVKNVILFLPGSQSVAAGPGPAATLSQTSFVPVLSQTKLSTAQHRPKHSTGHSTAQHSTAQYSTVQHSNPVAELVYVLSNPVFFR